MTTTLKDQYFEAIAKLSDQEFEDKAPFLTVVLGNQYQDTLRMRTRVFWERVTQDKLRAALALLDMAPKQSKSTAALMGKVMSAWKRRRMADGRDGESVWYRIDTILRSMMACTDKGGWCQCLPKATVAELEQMLEFLENLE